MRHCPQGRVHTGYRLRAVGSVPLARPGPGRTPPRDVCLAPGPLRALPTAATPTGAGAPHSSLEPLLRPACQNAPARQANPSPLYSEGAGRFPTCLGWDRFLATRGRTVEQSKTAAQSGSKHGKQRFPKTAPKEGWGEGTRRSRETGAHLVFGWLWFQHGASTSARQDQGQSH